MPCRRVLNATHTMLRDGIGDKDDLKAFDAMMDWPESIDADTWGEGAQAEQWQAEADAFFGEMGE